MLSYQNYKMSEVGSGISIITVNIYLPQRSRTLIIFNFLSHYYMYSAWILTY